MALETTAGTLPAGVRTIDLACHVHDRGTLTEIYRQDWWTYGPSRQWNFVTSPSGVLRGIHVHLQSAEYYVLLSGKALVGYQDVRPGSPTLGATAVVEIGGDGPVALVAPPGLAHGVYSIEPITLLVGTTSVWDPSAEVGCHWQDPDLGIQWPFDRAIVSAQDNALGRLRELLARVPRYS